jgi:hypothetical protein
MPETPSDADALGLYSVIGQDWPQFIRLLPEASDKAVQILHKIISHTRESPRGTILVRLYAQRNGIELCQTKN